MIIIRTSNGDVLINEKAIQSIVHNKEKKNVVVVQSDGRLWAQTIDDVETVIYANDIQPVNYESKGTKVEELEHTVEVCRGGADFYMKMWSNTDRLEKSLTHGLIEAVASALEVKEEHRHWWKVEREYEEAQKAYKRYREERARLIEGHNGE